MWPVGATTSTAHPCSSAIPELRAPGVVAEYQRALAAGDVDAILATFEPDAYAREPAGAEYVHRGVDGLRAFYTRLFSNGGGIPLEHCALVGTDRLCALEYNIVRWGEAELSPEAGAAVYVRGGSGMLLGRAHLRRRRSADPGPAMEGGPARPTRRR